MIEVIDLRAVMRVSGGDLLRQGFLRMWKHLVAVDHPV
jgi:hypothetical protein